MKFLVSFIKLIIYSNLFVSLCVAAFTHLTYIIYNLPKDNIIVVLLMVFSFTFFTYNGQRLFRLRKKLLQPNKLGERLKWVIKYKNALTFLTISFGIIGLICSFYISFFCLLILIPMGGLSVFYVIPLIPFYNKSPTLRDLPYLKIIIIGLVWSLIIVGLPFFETNTRSLYDLNIQQLNQSIILYSVPVFLFVIAITLPFDIRDIEFDRTNNLKTIPQILGLKKTIFLSELLLIGSILLLAIFDIKTQHFSALLIGHIITMLIIAFTNENRKELFFAGLVEGTVLILYISVLIADYFFL